MIKFLKFILLTTAFFFLNSCGSNATESDSEKIESSLKQPVSTKAIEPPPLPIASSNPALEIKQN
jgi:hypothetical protein